MTRKTRRRIVPSSLLAVLLALGLGVLSCENFANTGPEATDGAQPAYLLDSDDDGGDTEETDGTVESTDGATYTLVQERLPTDIDDLTVSKLIGVDGGRIDLAGHSLVVPEGSVDQVTLFTLRVVTSGYVDVELSATVTDLLGNVVQVGTEENPFNKPVTLTLTYARSPNVEEGVQDDLTILRMLGDDHDDLHEPLESRTDAETKTVTTRLDHFTGYCMAY